MFLESWKEIIINSLIVLLMVICLVYLIKLIARAVRAPEKKKEERQKKEKEEMSRGGILISSILIELLAVAILCVTPWFLPIGLSWKISITLIGFISILVMDFFLIYFWWAPNNLYFTFIPEGTAKHILKGKAYHKTLIQWKGHALATEKSRRVEIGDVIEIKEELKWWFFLRRLLIFIRTCFGGLRYYGFWPIKDVWIYDFSWTNRTQDGEIQKHPKQAMDYLLLKDDVFVVEVRDAEDKDALHADILLILTLRVVNPYQASFVVQNWLETVINRVVPAVRNEYTKDTYANWISEDKDLAERILKALRNFLENECRKRYGSEVRAIEVIDIDPGEGYRELTLRKFTAEQEKKATIVNAQAEVERVNLAYKAVEGFGPLGKLMKLLEALKESPGDGVKWVIPLPGTTDILSKVIRNVSEDVS